MAGRVRRAGSVRRRWGRLARVVSATNVVVAGGPERPIASEVVEIHGAAFPRVDRGENVGTGNAVRHEALDGRRRIRSGSGDRDIGDLHSGRAPVLGDRGNAMKRRAYYRREGGRRVMALRFRRRISQILMAAIVVGCATPAASGTGTVVIPSSAASATSESPAAASAPGSIRSTTPSSASSIEPLALSGRIVFTRAGGAFQDETIFVANADGTGERQLTPPGQTCCPRWSPDGARILIAASAADGRITTALIKPDGSAIGQVPLPSGTLNLGPGAWSPDGKRIAFDGFNDTDASMNGLYVGNTDGQGLVRLTSARAQPVDFTADGSRVIYFQSVSGFPSIGDQLEGSLFDVKTNGKDVRRLTPADQPVEFIGGEAGRLSPDGKSIVFTSGGAIWTMDADGSHQTQVFAPEDKRLPITPTWSPAGDLILFGLDPAGSLATVTDAPANELDVVGLDGTRLIPVVTSDDWKREPEWRS